MVERTASGTRSGTRRGGRISVRRVSVASSAVRSIGYDEKTRALDVEYDGGAVYRYFEVQPDTHRQLMEAESKGHFVNHRIKPAYRYAQIG